jgi:hypothetical protein
MHRLLSELKLLNKRIEDALASPADRLFHGEHGNQLVFIGSARESDTKIDTQTQQEFEVELKANLQKIRHLISNKKALEAAKVKSNAETLVRIADKEYTVADAIKRKTEIAYDKQLLSALELQLREAVTTVENKNTVAMTEAEKHVTALYGSEKKVADSNSGDVEKAREDYLKTHRWDVIDPNKVKGVISTLREDIECFEAEVDAVLSESNATTFVEVELED